MRALYLDEAAAELSGDSTVAQAKSLAEWVDTAFRDLHRILSGEQ